MRVEVRHHCSDFDSYRAARVKSLFNAENGCDWEKVAELPIEGKEWQIGLIVGPSGSGKTSIGSKIFNERFMTFIPVGTAINLLLTASLRTGILIWSPECFRL